MLSTFSKFSILGRSKSPLYTKPYDLSRHILFLIFALFISQLSLGQTKEKIKQDKQEAVAKPKKKRPSRKRTPKKKKPSEEIKPIERIYTPTLGLGAGVLTYYGELSKRYVINGPGISRYAFDISFTQPLNRFLSLSFYGQTGKIEANERSITRNLNFRSQLNGGGIQLFYNFDHILKKDRVAEPYIGVGFAAYEFLSKSDIRDKFGNTYFYWEDGTIRNIQEGSTGFENAVRIHRDYDYETDIRQAFERELGEYDEYFFSIPISAGANLKLNKRWNFKIGATFHYTFTDNLDGISNVGTGERKGDASNDYLLYTHGSIHYNLQKARVYQDIDDGTVLDDNEDSDQDGVIDIMDNCLGTPEGVAVDEFGCPLDDDKDDVGNYRDQELDSAPGAIVDSVGVTYTDERLAEMYARFMDSTGVYSEIETETHTVDVISGKTKRARNVNRTTYAIKVGEFEGAIPSDMVNSILSLPDVEVTEQGNLTILTIGNYDALPDAIKRQIELEKQGIVSSGIVSKDATGKLKSVDGQKSTFDKKAWDAGTGELIYRVQIGAFTRKANEKIFENLPEVLSISSDDGYNRYFSGSFKNYKEAADAKLNVIDAGFEDAFVVAIKNGKKIQLSEAGATVSPDFKENNTPSSSTLSPQERSELRFRIQVGSYKSQVPTEVIEKFMEIGSVEQKVGDDGVTRYIVGDYANYQEANNMKKKLQEEGFTGAFVVGQFKGELIPAKKAVEMAK